MTAPFVPQNVVQRWMNTILSADATVIAEVGAGNIYPNVTNNDAPGRHLTSTFGAGFEMAKPMGAPISQVGLFWDITAWEPGYSQQALGPLMEAVMGLLIGAETKGKRHRFVDGSRTWDISCDYFMDDYVPVDTSPSGAWAPIRERYRVTLRPTG